MDKRPIYYYQLDKRWAGYLYDINPADGLDYISGSGCGPTTAAMVIAQLADSSVTPPVMADFSIAHGDRTMSNGTAETLFKHAAEAYGLSFKLTYTQSVAMKCLDEGGLVACHVGEGRWTSGGHYIEWWGYGDGNCYINDPSGHIVRGVNRDVGTLAELQACRKAYMCFWPREEDENMTQDQFNKMYSGVNPLYATIDDVPVDWKAETQALVDAGKIKGTDKNNPKALNIRFETLRAIIVSNR